MSRACRTLSLRGRSPMVTWPLGSTVCEVLQMATGVWDTVPYSSIGLIPNVPTSEHVTRGVRLTSNGLSLSGDVVSGSFLALQTLRNP